MIAFCFFPYIYIVSEFGDRDHILFVSEILVTLIIILSDILVFFKISNGSLNINS